MANWPARSYSILASRFAQDRRGRVSPQLHATDELLPTNGSWGHSSPFQSTAGILRPQAAWHLRTRICCQRFPGAHGSRHLYNMLGGKVHEVDYIFAREIESPEEANVDYLKLKVSGKDSLDTTTLLAPKREQEIIAQALDCLPWGHLSWSIHRGMRDILLAYSKPTMDRFRHQLAALLKQTLFSQPHLLERKGWERNFFRSSMGEMAASTVLLGKGNSGDLVRVVTDIMRALVDEWTMDQLDEMHFWRLPNKEMELNLVRAVAITKMFIVE
jgi:hypothetical protein